MRCPSCNKDIPAGSKFCMHCGKQIKEFEEKRHCPHCHKDIPTDSMFCPFCGKNTSVKKRGSYIIIETTNSDCYIKSRYGDYKMELKKGVNEISIISCPWIYRGVEFYGKEERISQFHWEYDGIKLIDLSYYDTSNIVDMSWMFSRCNTLERLDCDNISTSKVTNMSVMFQSCSSLKYIDLSRFDTSQVKRMDNMFSGCSLLDSLDLSSFNTCKVEHMSGMFFNCSLLESLDLSNFKINCWPSNMFLGCGSLKTLFLKNCDNETIEVIKGELKSAGISPEIVTS